MTWFGPVQDPAYLEGPACLIAFHPESESGIHVQFSKISHGINFLSMWATRPTPILYLLFDPIAQKVHRATANHGFLSNFLSDHESRYHM